MSDETDTNENEGQAEPTKSPGLFKRLFDRFRKPLVVCFKVYVVLLIIATVMSFSAVRAVFYPLMGFLDEKEFSIYDYNPLFTTVETPTFLFNVGEFTKYEFKIFHMDSVRQLTSGGDQAKRRRDDETTENFQNVFDQYNHFSRLKPLLTLSGSVHAHDAMRADARVTLPAPMKPGEYLAVMGAPGQTQSGNHTAFARFIVTDLGAIVKHDSEKIVVSTVNLLTRKTWPEANLAVFCEDTCSRVETDAQGLATIERPANLSLESWNNAIVEGRSRGHLAILGTNPDGHEHQGNQIWQTSYGSGSYRTFFETDRPVYRIGQSINFKGATRKVTPTGLANPQVGTTVQVTVSDPQGNTLRDLTMHTDAAGTFKGQLQASEISKTGPYNFQLMYPDNQAEAFTLTVEQYRKPDFKIDVVPERRRFSRGEKVRFNIQANYYFGAPLKNAKVKYHINSYPDIECKERLKENRTADGGFFSGWVRDQRFHPYGGDVSFDKVGELSTDATGKAVLEFDAPKEELRFDNPYSADYLDDTFNVSVETTDLSSKTFTAEGAVPVTHGDFTVIIDSPRSVLKSGEDIIAKVKAVDYQQNPVKSQKVNVTLSRWKYEQNTFVSTEKAKRIIVSTVEATTDDKGEALVTFQSNKDFDSTYYYLNAEALDGKNNLVGDVTSVLYQSDSGNWYYDRSQEQEQYGISLDKDVYQPGDTVRAVIRAPVQQGKEAYVLATVEGASLRQYKQLRMTGPITVVEFPIDPTYMPNAYICASLVMDNHKPYNIEQVVRVSPTNNFVTVTLKTDKERYHPGESVKYTVSAKNKQGAPVSGMQLCASVVDEGMFSVRDLMQREGRVYGESQDIFQSIYRRIENSVVTKFTFMEKHTQTSQPSSVFDGMGLAILHAPVLIVASQFPLMNRFASQECEMSKMASAPGGGGLSLGSPQEESAVSGTSRAQAADATAVMGVSPVANARRAPTPRTRSNFADAVAWYPSLVTGANGTATFSVKLPDDLTTWRATVNGITTKIDVGSSSVNVVASQDFLARLALPRFYTEYDETTISGLVHNLSPVEQTVNVSLAVTPNIQILDSPTATIKIAKDGVKRQSWRIKVLKSGEAKVTLKAIGGTLADAEERKLPVGTFGYRVFFAKNGLIKEDSGEKSFPVVIPPDAKLSTGRFDIATSSSSIGPVLGSFEDLIDYPYGCTEQTLSKLIPSVVAMRLHKNLGVEMPEEMKTKFSKAYAIAMPNLVEYQHDDGGWGWWAKDTSDAYMTSHVLEGFYLLKQAGMPVDEGQIQRGRDFLSSRIVALSGDVWSRYSSEDHAKAVYVMSLFGDKLDPMTRTWQLINIQKMSPEALSYLTMAFKNTKDETAAQKTYARLKELRNDTLEYTNWDHTSEMLSKLGLDNRFDYSYRFTGVETTALALRATVMMEPKNEDLLNSITRWLVLERDENGWNNTKTTTAVYMALLEKEIAQSPARTTNFTARVEALNKVIKELSFSKTYERGEQLVSVPLIPTPSSIKLKKTGPGWLYYNTLFEYDRPLKPGEQPILKSLPADLKIQRELFRLIPEKQKGHVETTNRLELIGDQPVKSGDIIMIRVTVECPFEVPYVLVESALPSGGEVLQVPPPLTPKQKIDSVESDSWNWWTHQDVLDDKVAYFAGTMPSGKSVFRTFVRMEIPGKFNINPVSMEAMYTKKVHARSMAHSINVVTGD